MSLLIIGDEDKNTSGVIYAFDLDRTIINTKSGKILPINADDWEFIPKRKEKIIELQQEANVIIITNQKLKNTDLVKAKLDNVHKNLPGVVIYAALEDDEYRKPGIGIYKRFVGLQSADQRSNIKTFIYVGDAAGRSGDHSDSDAKFLFNVALYNKFAGNADKKCKFLTPEQFFDGDCTPALSIDKFTGYNPLDYINSYKGLHIAEKYSQVLEECKKHKIIIMSGPPASGKTSFAKALEKFGYFRISLDETKFKKSYLNNEKIVIDATHPNLDSIIKYGISDSYHIVRMDVDKQMAMHLNTIRSWYLGIDKIPTIAYNVYYKRLENIPSAVNVIPDIFRAPKEFVQLFAMRTT